MARLTAQKSVYTYCTWDQYTISWHLPIWVFRRSRDSGTTLYEMLEFVVSLLCVLSAPDDFSAAEIHLLESRPQRFQRAAQPA